MPRKLLRVRSFGLDGTVILEDGREMQAVVADTGSLGVRPKVEDDHRAGLDQYTGPPGAEPIGAPSGHFDISKLDQT